MMIDHIGLPVRNYEASKSFYQTVLKTLGYELMIELFGKHAGFGKNGKSDLWISAEGEPFKQFHIAFIAPNRQSVDEFYKAALAAGGKENGPPGLRPQYHENYYGAFVLDPDGYNIEAVCHQKA